MNPADVIVIIAAAAVGAAFVIIGVLRNSRTADEGVRRLRLLVNLALLGLHYATLGVAVALFGLGVVHQDGGYWFGALALLLVALMLFRDLSAPGRNPLREWFSRYPLRARVRGLEDEVRSSVDELSGTKSSHSRSPGECSAEPPHEGTKDAGRRTWKWTFKFQWPPKGGGS